VTFLKKLICALLCVLLSFFMFSFAAGAVSIDGTIGTLEWKNALRYEVFSHGATTNCDINFAYMRVLINKTDSEVYLAFQVMQKTAGALNEKTTLAGVKLFMKSGTSITCRSAGTNEYNINSYDVDSKTIIGTNNDFTAEIRIGFKFGVPENVMLGLQFIDSYGEPSNYYKWPIPAQTTTAAETTTKKQETTTVRETTTRKTDATTQKQTDTTVKETTEKPTASNPGNTSTVNNSGQQYSTAAASTADGSITQSSEQVTTQEVTGQTRTNGNTSSLANETDASVKPVRINRTKQIAAIAVAFLLIAIAVFLCVLAGKPKKNLKPSEKKEPEPDEVDDDDF